MAHLPLAEPVPGDPARLRLVLAGTAIAGALRTRAELICRTVGGQDPPDRFSDQLSGAPLAAVLFGHAAGVPGSTASPLVVLDCPSTTTLRAADWDTIINPPQGRDGRPDLPRSVPAANTDGTPAELRRTEHAGIDRWTGGASEARLFCEYEPHGFSFEPIRFRLRRDRISDPQVRDAATVLLLLTLRELAARRVPLGGRQQSGHGDVKVTRMTLRGAGLDADGTRPPDLTTSAPELASLRRAWRAYLGREDPS
ncbi:MAG TPA: RAMP superfamily CRISPR-associated protein [Pseudonocardiaceae bacterium]|nr:RAMP superfamily CRISPR-associated protein [Pseudonocardiaceae bacterium]